MFGNTLGPEDRSPRRRSLRPRFSVSDTPLVAGFTAVVTLGLAVVLFLVAMPSDERVLVYRGEQVAPTDLCETVDASGDTVLGSCLELGEFETYRTGWGTWQLVAAGVLAAGGAVVAFSLPKQIREHRRQEQRDLEQLTDEDHRSLS
jgi:hypothetical protein